LTSKIKYSDFILQLPKNVNLVAVSKTKSNEDIMELYNLGQRDFGENYVQELVSKQETLPKDIRWHFIGHLQTNKVKYIAPFVYLIHSVDSLKLLKEIDKQGEKNNRKISCLIQSYVGNEETKYGLNENEVLSLLNSEEVVGLLNISLKGLMGMASNTVDENQIKKEFHQLKNIFDSIKNNSNAKYSFEFLSMGMSGDYNLAISEGSNMIRPGSILFGERNYQK
jgi:pyridoxal phosphate enzyme (YggS family)